MKRFNSLFFIINFLGCISLFGSDMFIKEVDTALKNRDEEALTSLLLQYKQEIPVYDSLLETEIGEKYYSIGSYMFELYGDSEWDDLLFMLKCGASGFIETGDMPLVVSLLPKAITTNNSKLLLELLLNGAAVNSDISLGNINPDLSMAIKRRSYSCLKTLLDFGIDPNQSYMLRFIGEPGYIEKYVIFDAVEDTKAMNILLSFGADINVIQKKVSESHTTYSKIKAIDGKYEIEKYQK